MALALLELPRCLEIPYNGDVFRGRTATPTEKRRALMEPLNCKLPVFFGFNVRRKRCGLLLSGNPGIGIDAPGERGYGFQLPDGRENKTGRDAVDGQCDRPEGCDGHNGMTEGLPAIQPALPVTQETDDNVCSCVRCCCGGEARFPHGSHGFEKKEINTRRGQPACLFTVFFLQFRIRRHKIGPVTILKRSNGSRDQDASARRTCGSLAREIKGQACVFRGIVGKCDPAECAARRPEGVGDKDIGSCGEIIPVNL